MSEGIYLSVIIPGRNQGKELTKTLNDICEHSKKFDFDIEVISVDGNSTDETNQVLESFKGKIKYFSTYKDTDMGDPRGKGTAVKLGMMKAVGEVRMFMDADSSVPFSDIDKFLPYFKEGYDAVIGSRYVAKPTPTTNNAFKAFWKAFKEVMELIFTGKTKSNISKKKQGWFRQFMSRGGNLAFATVLGIGLSDSRCGFKAFSRDLADKVFPYIKISGFSFEEEVFILAKKHGFKTIEVPVSWTDVAEDTNINPAKDSIKAILSIFKVKWYVISGQYNAKKQR